MSPTVLVVNSGSSSIKYRLVEVASGAALAGGIVERIGEHESRLEHMSGTTTTTTDSPVANHDQGMARIVAAFEAHGPDLDAAEVAAVGHRVVMGGRHFAGPVLLDDAVIATIERLAPLAPLHQGPNLSGIRAARALLPSVPQVAVFDTAFFHDLPDTAATYAIDRDVAEAHEIRRYGFHGTSHQFVSAAAATLLGRDLAELRQVVLHLGNGASASAIRGGRPVDTSMGLTPLEGLVMGTRCGDIDAAVVAHLHRGAGMSVEEVDHLLNHRSGMLGLTGENDLREVHRLIAAGDAAAALGLEVYVHRLRKYIGAYAAVLGGLDVLVFTAGVGEHDAAVRAKTAEGLGFLGIEVDEARNAADPGTARVISPDGARVAVVVVPTDEELAIARQAVELLPDA